jgi:hypothetical protein
MLLQGVFTHFLAVATSGHVPTAPDQNVRGQVGIYSASKALGQNGHSVTFAHIIGQTAHHGQAQHPWSGELCSLHASVHKET